MFGRRRDLRAYFAFDPARGERCRSSRPSNNGLRRGTPAVSQHAHQGDRLWMELSRQRRVARPALGVALQKNYISVYVSVRKNGLPQKRLADRAAPRGSARRVANGRTQFQYASEQLAETQKPARE